MEDVGGVYVQERGLKDPQDMTVATWSSPMPL